MHPSTSRVTSVRWSEWFTLDNGVRYLRPLRPSPDGKLTVAQDEGLNCVVVPLDGATVANARIAPDGRSYAYTTQRMLNELYLTEGLEQRKGVGAVFRPTGFQARGRLQSCSG